MITAGIDMGIQTVKVVILKDGVVVARAKAFSGFEPTKAAEQAFAEALKEANAKKEEVSLGFSYRFRHGYGSLLERQRKHDGRRRQSRSLSLSFG